MKKYALSNLLRKYIVLLLVNRMILILYLVNYLSKKYADLNITLDVHKYTFQSFITVALVAGLMMPSSLAGSFSISNFLSVPIRLVKS